MSCAPTRGVRRHRGDRSEAERPDDECSAWPARACAGSAFSRGRPDRAVARHPGYRRMFAAGARHHLAICPLIDPSALPALDAISAPSSPRPPWSSTTSAVSASAATSPLRKSRRCAAWRATRRWVKVSAFYALGSKKPPHDDLVPLIRRVVEAFGADRLMWASDCPFQVVEKPTKHQPGARPAQLPLSRRARGHSARYGGGPLLRGVSRPRGAGMICDIHVHIGQNVPPFVGGSDAVADMVARAHPRHRAAVH